MTVFHFLDHNGTAPPAIPGGLNVSNITNTSATFSWTPVGGATLYHLRYKTTAETIWTGTSINIPSITVTGLSAGTSYDYACEAVGSGGPSGYSATQTFTTSTIVLPINVIDMMARRQGANVLVSWSTQSEQNSAWFDVERSIDGINFTRVGQVQAAGYSANLRNYRFTDVNVAKSMLFYRLKMIDADGSYKLSTVRVVAKTGDNMQEFLLYPNPAIGYVNITLPEAAAKDLQVRVTNQMGQIVKTSRVSTGIQLIKLDISELPKGIYAVAIIGNEVVEVKKLIIR
jgi:Secretion system C-terminal sorting domain/Fibronectin type III domain